MKIGYARTSTIDQEAGLEAQIRDLNAAGCDVVFSEQVSSVEDTRPKLEAAIAQVTEGDVFVVTKIDRLARSVVDLHCIHSRLKARGGKLSILGMGIDTSGAIGALLFNIIGSVAEFERSIMLERQREGIAKAKRDGRYANCGRPRLPNDTREEVIQLFAEGTPKAEIARRVKIGRRSVDRIINEYPADARQA